MRSMFLERRTGKSKNHAVIRSRKGNEEKQTFPKGNNFRIENIRTDVNQSQTCHEN